MHILGLSCDYHDAAAALITDGVVVAAAEEERFTRIKHDRALPERSVASCLAIAGLGPDDIDVVIVHEKPIVVASRIVSARQRRGLAALSTFAREAPILVRKNLLIGYRIEQLFRALGGSRHPDVRYSEHHLSHASGAFFPSPFDHAAVITVDGIGEWSTATIGEGTGNHVVLHEEQRYPHSLGLLYSLVTAWCGFEPNDGEYKLMGLAPYGRPTYAGALRKLVSVDGDGALTIDPDAVRWWSGDPRRMKRVVQLLGGPPREPDEPLTERHADLARSVQELTEEIMLRMARHAYERTGSTNLCLAGGVALNCVANGRLLRDGPFDEIWVQPAPGDAGSSIGAALWHWYDDLGHERAPSRGGGDLDDGMSGAALGPRFEDDEVAQWLSEIGQHSIVLDPQERATTVARRLAGGAIVGWFDGRMEFGPRALGHRSILADPRSPNVHRDLNLRVKGRESFRPFAPSVLWEHAQDWFAIDRPSPYMLFTHQVAAERLLAVDDEPTEMVDRARVPRSEIPACTHVDGSARVQTVHAELHPEYHRLLTEFQDITGCPVLLNTSFNRAGEPIVATPEDALTTARAAGLDLLVVGSHLIDLRDDHR